MISHARNFALGPESVHVWHDYLDRTPGQIAGLFSLLSPDECARAKHYHAAEHRDRFIVARGLLRQVLGRYTGDVPEKLRFSYHPRGKPALDPLIVHFNIAHSANRVLIAVATEPVGVDLEAIRVLPFEELARTALPPAALAELQQVLEDERGEAFFRIWTMHEARAKVAGGGLGAEVPQLPAYALEVGAGFKACVATAVANLRIEYREIAECGVF